MTIDILNQWDSFNRRFSKATPTIEPETATLEDQQQTADIGTPKEEINDTTNNGSVEISKNNSDNTNETSTDTVISIDKDKHTSNETVDQQENNPQDHDWKKRCADKDRYITELKGTLKELKKEVEDLKKKPDLSKLKTPEEIDAFKKDNPELSAIFETLILEKNKDVQEKLAEIARKEAWIELRKIHTDADEIANTEQFKDWVSEQPTDIQNLVYSDANHLKWGKALSLYKLEMGITNKASKELAKVDAKKEEKKKAAMNVVSSSIGVDQVVLSNQSKRVWKESEIKALKPSDWDKYGKEITEALQRGEVLKDLTRSRR